MSRFDQIPLDHFQRFNVDSTWRDEGRLPANCLLMVMAYAVMLQHESHTKRISFSNVDVLLVEFTFVCDNTPID